jgi:hypothetical protein
MEDPRGEDKVFVGKEEGDFHKPREEEPKEENGEVLVVVPEHRKRGSIDEDTLF